MGAVFSEERHLKQHDSQDHLKPGPIRLKEMNTKHLLSSIEKTCNEWLETIKNINSDEVGYDVNSYLSVRLNETVQKFQDFFESSSEESQRSSPPQRGNQHPHGRSPQRQHAVSPRGGRHGNQQMQQGILPHIGQIKEFQRKNDQHEKELEEERQMNAAAIKSLAELKDNLERRVKKLEEEKRQLLTRESKLEEEKRQLLTRLSAVVGEKLCKNNPDIADLSDPNRPTKIGEQFSELYDDEWTNAYEELESAGYTEREAIDTLRLTLESTYTFCGEKSEALISSVESVANQLFTDETKPASKSMTLCMKKEKTAMLRKEVSEITLEKFKLQARWKPKEGSKASMDSTQIEKKPSNKEYDFEGKLKQLRKEVGLAMIPMVQKAYMKEMWSSSEHVASLKPFIRKCLRVCWFMVIQTPPMCIELGDLHGQKFEKDRFKAYTCEGQQIDYMVWPPLRLHDKGALVTKGIAQGIRPGSLGISKE